MTVILNLYLIVNIIFRNLFSLDDHRSHTVSYSSYYTDFTDKKM